MATDANQEALLYPCPRCKAPAGEPCIGHSLGQQFGRSETTLHAPRVDRAIRVINKRLHAEDAEQDRQRMYDQPR